MIAKRVDYGAAFVLRPREEVVGQNYLATSSSSNGSSSSSS
jgi:hypothetical protein